MAIELSIKADTASSQQNLTILGQSTTIELTFNSTDKKWRLSLYDQQNTPILLGVVLSSGQSPTKKYSLDFLVGGNFWLFKKRDTKDLLGYSNFGFNKDYGLFFLTTDEEEALGL